MARRYPRVCAWVSFKEQTDGMYLVEDSVNGTGYEIESVWAQFLLKMDGKTDPFTAMKGYPRRHVQNMISASFALHLLRCDRIWNVAKSRGTFMLTVVENKNTLNHHIAAFFNILLLLLWLPIFLIGVYTFISDVHVLNSGGSVLLGTVVGVGIGGIFHEMGHAIAAIGTKDCHFYEAGISLENWLPGAYALIDDSSVRNPLVRAQVDLAGVEMNMVLSGIGLTSCILAPNLSGFFFAFALANLSLALLNITVATPLDGRGAINALLETKNRDSQSQYTLVDLIIRVILLCFKAFIPLSHALLVLELLEGCF